VRRCQTWEGGIAGEEGLEAHGGYAYCGLAALGIIGKAHALDLDALLHWAVRKQMSLEGGFAAVSS
jgi:protein farnesyltransferase subunit beta